jgi:beta-barrel assembly-enhancing protease
LISFLIKIQKYSLAYAPKIPAYLSTHPAVENRISLLENLLQLEPKPKGPFREMGNFKRIQIRAFVEEREPDAAVSHFESRVKANPQDMDAIFGLGLAFRKMGRTDKATEAFQIVRSVDPKNTDVLRELGIVYLLSGKVDQAIETLEGKRSLSLSVSGQDSDLQSLYYLGKAYQERGDFAQALAIFLKVKKETPDFADVYYNLGSVYGRMGQKGQSHLSFGRHFKLKGEREKALLHFGTALEWLEKDSMEREEARREIRELTQKK